MHDLSKPGQVGNDKMKEKDMKQERKRPHKYVKLINSSCDGKIKDIIY